MNLVCFSNFTAGGLLCDLLNNTDNLVGCNCEGKEHSAFKIGDTPTIQTSIDLSSWSSRIYRYSNTHCWYGTHIHPSAIPNLTLFAEIIAITTSTRQSKLYRWLRYYNWFKNAQSNWKETNELAQIDKVREMSKNVFVEFSPHPDCKNVEFEDIVNGNFVSAWHLNIDYFSNWLAANPWLFSTPDTWAIKRFNEAEWELHHNQPYKYL